MPGYLTIPFNFDLDELIKYFNENKYELFKIKEKVNYLIIILFSVFLFKNKITSIIQIFFYISKN